MAFTSMPEQSGLARGLFIALSLGLLLLGYGLLRYRDLLTFTVQGLPFAGLLLALCILFVAYAFVGREISEGFGRNEIWAQHRGVNFGSLAGLLWIVEIVVSTLLPTPTLIVDSICAVGLLALAFIGGSYGARYTRTFSFGLKIGLWSGMLGALIAWIALLLFTYILMGRLQHDPRTIQSFTQSGDSDIATYLVRSAIFGAAARLVIGPVLGLAAGAAGALLGRALARRESGTQEEAGAHREENA